MKLLLAAVIIFTTATVGYGDEPSWQESCSAIGSLAETTMRNRQLGVPMEAMIRPNADSFIEKFDQEIVIMAYERPRYSTEKMRTRSVEDFRDTIYLECVKKLRPKT